MFRSLEQVQRTIQMAIMMTPIHNSNHIVLYYTLLTSHSNSPVPFIGKIELSQANTPKNAVFGELTDYGINYADKCNLFSRFRVLDYSL